MRKQKLKPIIIALTLVLALGFMGCGNSSKKSGSESKGSITAVGSSALQPLVMEVADLFMSENPEIQVNVQGGGSGTGLSQVSQGAVQIGNSDIFAEEKLKGDEIELARELIDHKVCVTGYSMVVNKNVKVNSLTKNQIQDIFQGKITNWKQVGGDDIKIEVINRSKASGTRASFKKSIMDGKEENTSIGTIQDSSGAVQKTIEATEGAISYLPLSYFVKEDAKSEIKLLSIDGVEPNKENITLGKYPFWSYEHMYTKGEPKGMTKKFIDYVVSDKMKGVIEKNGYISIKDMKI